MRFIKITSAAIRCSQSMTQHPARQKLNPSTSHILFSRLVESAIKALIVKDESNPHNPHIFKRIRYLVLLTERFR
ncbi:hypothetical protein BWP39_21815 [Paraburkholderia acidicola]|uniref:Uncharacterized protein n=1 Tax=Paraburkholderia acidicola TaxID=1912599 RepID=A0A2A4EQ76_9BURK|nr:hypothetical protein BWP39_21815 [Paraburkholderia acidicola]